MPKRNKMRKQARGRGNGCTVRGKIVQTWNQQQVQVVNAISLHPIFGVVTGTGGGTPDTIGNRKTLGMHELWRFYRFNSLKFRWLHASANTSGMYRAAAAYVGGDLSAAQAPANVDDVYEQSFQFDPITIVSAPTYASGAPISSVQIPSVPKRQTVPHRELLTRQPNKWWYCDPTATVVSGVQVYQGDIYIAWTAETGDNTQTVTYSFELEYVIDFSEFRLATVATVFRSLGYKGPDRLRGLQIVANDDDEDEKSGVDIDDASLSIIANSTTGFGAAHTKVVLAERTRLAELALAKARVARLEEEIKNDF